MKEESCINTHYYSKETSNEIQEVGKQFLNEHQNSYFELESK